MAARSWMAGWDSANLNPATTPGLSESASLNVLLAVATRESTTQLVLWGHLRYRLYLMALSNSNHQSPTSSPSMGGRGRAADKHDGEEPVMSVWSYARELYSISPQPYILSPASAVWQTAPGLRETPCSSLIDRLFGTHHFCLTQVQRQSEQLISSRRESHTYPAKIATPHGPQSLHRGVGYRARVSVPRQLQEIWRGCAGLADEEESCVTARSISLPAPTSTSHAGLLRLRLVEPGLELCRDQTQGSWTASRPVSPPHRRLSRTTQHRT